MHPFFFASLVFLPQLLCVNVLVYVCTCVCVRVFSQRSSYFPIYTPWRSQSTTFFISLFFSLSFFFSQTLQRRRQKNYKKTHVYCNKDNHHFTYLCDERAAVKKTLIHTRTYIYVYTHLIQTTALLWRGVRACKGLGRNVDRNVT
jgi:hypothetical protein